MTRYTFTVEPDPGRKNGWRVVTISEEGHRLVLPGRFRKEHLARAEAYKLEVLTERRRNRPIYLGD